jgi:peptidoglycan/xylan/chitin deacetylase (PgdA/CDA1 family)
MAERLPRQNCLIVLNYHRVGEAAECEYDHGVVSATPEEFEWQLAWLRRRYEVIGEQEALEAIGGTKRRGGARVLLTFDDGYLDNYEVAFPILRSMGLTGLFFLTVDFTDGNTIPWWDRMAWMVKRSVHRQFRLACPSEQRFDLDTEGIDGVLLRLFRLYKSPEVTDAGLFLEAVAEATRSGPPGGGRRLFLNWAEAREMARGGMEIGSHTCSHAVLSKLGGEEQYAEFDQSRRRIREELGVECRSVAYPYGLRHNVNAQTAAAAERSGYRLGFSFYGGINRPGETAAFDVRREAASGGVGRERFRMQLAVAAVTGRYWF